MNFDPIPTVREEDATGETAAIYADLRATLGLPLVNLIWRHLAALPGGLAATWAVAKPLYLTQDLGRSAAGILGSCQLPGGLALPPFLWDCAGLDIAARREIAVLIAEYNRANASNLLGLLATSAVLGADPAVAAQAGSETVPHPPTRPAPPAIRPLPGLSELSPPVLDLVNALDAFGRIGPSIASASLYRHLAHWPSFLALAYAALAPHHASGELRAEQERLIAAGREMARDLTPHAGRLARTLDPADRRRILGALDEFTGLMIGRMIVMGSALLALLPDGSR